MSATTLDNPITTTIQREYLHDYDIHLTGDNNAAPAPPNTDNARPQPVGNPPDWDDDHRGVPPYRPINTELDLEQRPWGSNGFESAFVAIMLHGVMAVAVSSLLISMRAPCSDSRLPAFFCSPFFLAFLLLFSPIRWLT